MKTWPTLYKMTSTGKIQQWTIVANNDVAVPYYEVTFGQKDGKLQTTIVEVASGKNIGKKNETTPAEQCIAEAESLWTKKIDRSGYSTVTPNSKPLKPMLAKEFEKHKDKVKYPAAVQPKLDGCRFLAHIKNGEVKFVSRQNKKFTSLEPQTKELSSFPDCILDGEVYNPNLTFQQIVSSLKKDKYDGSQDDLYLYVYDCISDETFKKRYEFLCELYSKYCDGEGYFQLVETWNIDKPEHIQNWHEEYVQSGYEGLMIRNWAGKYKINGRSSDLLKLKSFITEEFKIVNVLPGKGKFSDQGIFECEHKGLKFGVTPSVDEETKREYLANKDKYIGKDLTVKFFEWTTSDIPLPRFPIGVSVRNYEN